MLCCVVHEVVLGDGSRIGKRFKLLVKRLLSMGDCLLSMMHKVFLGDGPKIGRGS